MTRGCVVEQVVRLEWSTGWLETLQGDDEPEPSQVRVYCIARNMHVQRATRISVIAGPRLCSSIMPSSSDTPSTIQITIFTGFLGAGKTSIILSLLPQLPKSYRVVLLKNEFGDIEGYSPVIRLFCRLIKTTCLISPRRRAFSR